MSIGAIKGIEFGSGFACGHMQGSEFNDHPYLANGQVRFAADGAASAISARGGSEVQCVSLDAVMAGAPATYIKMDIEGAEPQALRGARNIIQNQKPKLAICIYHDFRHLWEVPLYIKSLAPEYKIYLRHHTNLEYETVCYAV